ncbi:tRNA-splicing endonuclease subunit sen54, partial [Ascosphaera pollenicola]
VVVPDAPLEQPPDGGLSDFVVSDDDQPPTADNLPTDNLSTSEPIQPATRTSPTVSPRHEDDASTLKAHKPPPVPADPIPEPPTFAISDDIPTTLPNPEEDGEDDIRTALQRMTRRTDSSAPQLKATPTQQPSTGLPAVEKQTPKSVQSRQPASETPIIDLTLDDDDDVSQPPWISSLFAVNAATQRPQAAARPPVHEDANKKVSPTRLPNPAVTQPTVVNVSDLNPSEVPEITNVEKILRIPIAWFQRRKDSDNSDRLLARILYGLRSNQRNMLDQAFTAHCGHKRLRAAILNGASKLPRRHLKSMAISQPSQPELLARCYTSWVNTRDIVLSPAHIPPNFSISDRCSKNKLKKFVKISLICLEAASKLQSDPVEEIEDITDLDELEWEESADTPHSKKRKRKVAESAEAMDIQRTAQRRVEDQEKQQRRLARKLERMGVSNEDPERQAVSFAPELYLHPHIGRRVKPHQLKGIQFLFREIVKDKRHQGALLAHTMGLGKTMQVISLLVTLAIAGGSEGSQKQIPEHLRESRSLVLCPSSLIENWFEECLMWIPHDAETQRLVGQVRKITSLLTPFERISTIQRWYSDGGILLLSYDIFRELVINKKKRLGEESHAIVRQQLLQGPKIIVADEAHKFKNRSTGLSSACAQFKSTSRIALTGSPLSNHLEDYYAMIDWIAPGYLGDFVQFKAKYMEPIESGLYADSTRGEKRLSLRKLAVLKRDLDPKVQRADITAIADDLPPKTEFVVTVPLTELQKQAYNSYIESLFLNKVDDIAQTKLWDWLAILSLLCNHPACFMKKLEDRRRKLNINNNVAVIHDAEEKSGVSDIEENSISSGDRAVSEMPATATERLQQIFSSVPDIMFPSHSRRMQAVELIIRSSIEVGDKVLIFSHSIPTLDYMESMLKGRVAYSRLDGKTLISSRQAATKDFNMENSTTQVYLISMKAGGLGLNIPGANRVIILDFGFNPSWEEQAVGRAYRLGQKKSV